MLGLRDYALLGSTFLACSTTPPRTATTQASVPVASAAPIADSPPPPLKPFAGKLRSVPAPAAYHVNGAAIEIEPNKVLLMGGGAPDANAIVEIVDASGGESRSLAPMSAARRQFTAARLRDGRVLAAGGARNTGLMGDARPGLASAEIYDARANAWRAAAPMHHVRWQHAMATLPDGRVLVAGGQEESDRALASAEIYDPEHDAWTDAPPLATARTRLAMVALPDGRVIAIGGYDRGAGEGFASTEIFDPTRRVWSAGPALHKGVSADPVVRLRDGGVLVLSNRSAMRVMKQGDSMAVTVVGELLRPGATAWTPIAEQPEAGGALGAVAIALGNGGALRCGAVQHFGSTQRESQCHAYDPSHDAWTALPVVPVTVHGPMAALESGGALLLGTGATARTAHVVE